MKNLIIRAITGVFFVAAIVACFLRPQAMVFLFALITGLTIWEFCGLVNDRVASTNIAAESHQQLGLHHAFADVYRPAFQHDWRFGLQ